MLRRRIILTVIITILLQVALAQEIIALPFEKTTEITWEGDEKTYFSDQWNTQVVTNVSIPTMEVYRPAKPNGTSVVIAPVVDCTH